MNGVHGISIKKFPSSEDVNHTKNKIRQMDNISIEDEVEAYSDYIDDAEFDEKIEYVKNIELAQSKENNNQINLNVEKNEEESVSLNNIDTDSVDYHISDDLDKLTIQDLNSQNNNYTSKSKFYLPDEAVEITPKTEYTKFYPNESLIFTLNNVVCLYSSSILKSNFLKNTSTDTIQVKGKLILTNYQLVFIPNKKHTDVCELDERYLSLFTHERPLSFVIPLTFIYELRTSNSSHKYRPLSNVLENTSTGVLRDILIKCKNFMTKLFFFSNPAKDYHDIYTFITKLTYHSNYQRVIHERFKFLIQDINTKFVNKDVKTAVHKTISQELDHMNEEKETDKQIRKSYLTPSDLQLDIIQSECDSFMQVKSGFAVQDKFKIKTNMPFCAIPKNIADIIMHKRVVINEQNVIEFANDFLMNPRNSHLSPSSSNSRFSKRASTLMGSSPRSTKSHYDKSVILNQQPVLASVSISNPFFDNQFPVWSFTNSLTGCSLVTVPDAATNRKEECDVIVKNYNAFLCDENVKLKKLLEDNRVSIGSSNFNEYEFYKFQVPFDHTDITKTYLRLMEICSFKTKADYIKTNDSSSFYLRLQNSKWLKKVSTIISLASKIINCLHFGQRNVFLEELRSNKDCSCIITSLVKMCMHQRNRTIIGFENIIQQDWFLAGHLFNKRLQTPHNHEDLDSSDPTDNSNQNSSSQIAPTFLLFLDCIFQLSQQYPDEFEFNEIYLIHTWDYACSSLSYSFSFDGIMSFLNYLNNQTFLAPNLQVETSVLSTTMGKNITIPKFENIFLNEVYELNSSFWLSHLNRNIKLLTNKNFNLKSEKDVSILSPNDRIYALKFWSRCYLRWHEKHHAYKSDELDLIQNESVVQNTKLDGELVKNEVIVRRLPSVAILHTRPAPAPPIFKQYTDETPVELSRQDSSSSKTFVTETGIKITTRTTEDGNIQSSF